MEDIIKNSKPFQISSLVPFALLLITAIVNLINPKLFVLLENYLPYTLLLLLFILCFVIGFTIILIYRSKFKNDKIDKNKILEHEKYILQIESENEKLKTDFKEQKTDFENKFSIESFLNECEFLKDFGVWRHKKTGIYYCPNCIQEGYRSPMGGKRREIECPKTKKCGFKCDNPEYQSTYYPHPKNNEHKSIASKFEDEMF